MPKHILIVGGGVGGTITANLLAHTLSPQEAEVTLISASEDHLYMPAWLYIPFQGQDNSDARPESSLLDPRVKFIVGTATHIDTKQREVTVEPPPQADLIGNMGGAKKATFAYDYLVLATGARLYLEDLPGLSEGLGKWHDFYHREGAQNLYQALQEFQKGRIVVAIGGVPYRCPPAPLEFVFLLDEWLSKRGIRDQVEIEYLYPLPRVFPIETVAELVTPLLEERKIKYQTFVNLAEVDTEKRQLTSLEGDSFTYDLLVIVPPHRGAKVIEESGLGDAQGWLPTDRYTLEVKGQEGVFAIGDATDLPVSKSGSAAHFEAKVVTARIVASLREEAQDTDTALYDGEVMCFLETGYGKATQLVFDYSHPPAPPRPNRYYHLEKQLFNRLYWYIVPSGRV
ncbi:MAG TPA: FAD/NAD(P)-binding oxidoreductase [Chthonomonas sp.]|uniref:NAD(P)/FAD-dependent oxidoreductase n=1 Tax=Chthonomonas sp. TaxID=2282153 RepID=UPI002B4ADADA|nr:FAD/NAD(P)-binding oxidoreductase [Chthonomonas sp.]HLH81298.1 FAD/NAD(P)-binding oxidoreductase [Chthonomonas sp.]